ncbi:hypothetical protein ElyMa_001631000 [Elysia marginata]|uniref:IBB domain-containing protein n=1 Tax=Elysia marginata TaxID=1093978 RepID=A0AAV4JR61_9GAST|nr:hypothetical protein ElyMa_001631000 [Elysia marginata]
MDEEGGREEERGRYLDNGGSGIERHRDKYFEEGQKGREKQGYTEKRKKASQRLEMKREYCEKRDLTLRRKEKGGGSGRRRKPSEILIPQDRKKQRHEIEPKATWTTTNIEHNIITVNTPPPTLDSLSIPD